MKVRRKEPIEAFLWTGGPGQTEDPEWIAQAIEDGDVWFENSETSAVRMMIGQDDGPPLDASPGSWIINEFGHIFYLTPGQFEKYFEILKAE